MRVYLAPLEGITGFVYRNIIFDMFEGVDKYFTPFYMPHIKRSFNAKEWRDINPENNKGVPLVPQILTDNAEDLVRFAGDFRAVGYDEINLNLGCPSSTVTSKGRGSGFLKRVDELDRFLDEVYSKADFPLSIKTRIGWSDPEEFVRLLEIYNRYPIHELTIHPRTREERYFGVPHLESFEYALRNSKNPVCYNSDVFTVEDYRRLVTDTEMLAKEHASEKKPANVTSAVMIGRGILANPALARELKGGRKVTMEEYKAYLARIRRDYSGICYDDKLVLGKCKELWFYIRRHFPEKEWEVKKLMKSKRLDEYLVWEEKVLGL